MDSRKLNRPITILKPQGGQDEIGQPIETWVPLCPPLWADILHLSGVESIKAGADTSVVKASFRIRRRTDVTSDMRVVSGAATYQIKAVLPDEEFREKVDLSCELINGG